MVKVLSIIITMMISVLAVYYIANKIKKSKSIYEKLLYMTLIIIYFVPIIIYYLDRYNIPTRLNYTKSMDVDRWFDFISSYLVNIVGALLSGTILVLITIKQLEIQKENSEAEKELNIEREKERKRIDYMPIVALRAIDDDDCAFDKIIQLNNGGNNPVIFRIDIENVGLGVMKNCYLKVKDNKTETSIIINITEREVIPIKSFIDKYLLLFNVNEHTELTTTVYYSDMFDNYYSQIINISISKTGIFDKGKEKTIIKTKTHDYKLLKSKPTFISQKEKITNND